MSNYGRILSFKQNKSGRLLRPNTNPQGYEYTSLSLNKKMYCFKVHRLVAKAFIPNPDNKGCIDHIDRDKHNNRADNLRWCTLSENQQNTNTLKHRMETFHKGLNHKSSCAILQCDMEGNIVKEWGSIRLAAKALNLCPSTIRVSCVRGTAWANSLWRYKEDGHAERIASMNINYRKKVRAITAEGSIIEFDSISQGAKYFGIKKGACIRACLIGKVHTSGGVRWEYIG